MLESMSRVSMIACGRDHTMALIEESYVPIQFAKDGNVEALCYWLENNPMVCDLDEQALKAELASIALLLLRFYLYYCQFSSFFCFYFFVIFSIFFFVLSFFVL